MNYKILSTAVSHFETISQEDLIAWMRTDPNLPYKVAALSTRLDAAVQEMLNAAIEQSRTEREARKGMAKYRTKGSA